MRLGVVRAAHEDGACDMGSERYGASGGLNSEQAAEGGAIQELKWRTGDEPLTPEVAQHLRIACHAADDGPVSNGESGKGSLTDGMDLKVTVGDRVSMRAGGREAQPGLQPIRVFLGHRVFHLLDCVIHFSPVVAQVLDQEDLGQAVEAEDAKRVLVAYGCQRHALVGGAAQKTIVR